jgi:hypothetical protein
MMKKISFFLSFLSFFCICQQLLHSKHITEEEPWFAGTMLAFYATNTPYGEFSIQPYVFATQQYGTYNKHWSLERKKSLHQIELLSVLSTGLLSTYLDANLVLNTSFNQRRNKHSIQYGDTQLYFGSQLLMNRKGTPIPDLRLILLQSFPTGKYKKLNPKKGGVDASGSGSYQTTFLFVTRKIFYDILKRPCNLNLNLYYILSTKTNVEDLTVYGGGLGTRGNVDPGDQFIANLAFEYSLTQNLGWGIDIHYEHQNRSPFSQKEKSKTVPKAGLPSQERLSLAPCLEYNFNNLFSIEGGAWFSVAGRNTNAFVSGIVTIYYAF